MNRTTGGPDVVTGVPPREAIWVTIKGCARCGGEHLELKFDWLERPMAPEDAPGIVWDHWASCPINGQPILLRTTEIPLAK